MLLIGTVVLGGVVALGKNASPSVTPSSWSTGPSPPNRRKNSTVSSEHYRRADRKARDDGRSLNSGSVDSSVFTWRSRLCPNQLNRSQQRKRRVCSHLFLNRLCLLSSLDPGGRVHEI